MELSEKSKQVIERWRKHFDRCQQIKRTLGPDEAEKFHLKYKGDPASNEAEAEFKKLVIN